jgi:hypothetical protein
MKPVSEPSRLSRRRWRGTLGGMRISIAVALALAMIAAPAFASAQVTVAEPTGDLDPAFLAELKAAIETVVRDAAPPPAAKGEVRSSATEVDEGVALVVELAPADGSASIREVRTASRASAVPQARAMARELLKRIAAPPARPTSIAPPPEPAPPPPPPIPPKFRLEAFAMAGFVWMDELLEATGGFDFGLGWVFARGYGIGIRLSMSWLNPTYSCYDGECYFLTHPKPDDSGCDPTYDICDENSYGSAVTTFATILFDLAFGDMRRFYGSLAVGLRTGGSAADHDFLMIPEPYLGLGFTVVPVGTESAAFVLRAEVGYSLLTVFVADGKGIESHFGLGVQF